MQVNNLPTDIQNKIFYFLEHPTAAIIKGHTIYHIWYFYHEAETQIFFFEQYHIESQLRQKLQVKYITTEETKKLDPLFLHMHKETIERVIIDHDILVRNAQMGGYEDCYCELKECQCLVLRDKT